jgi:hypothetical protein
MTPGEPGKHHPRRRDMSITCVCPPLVETNEKTYEAPRLTIIGQAIDVVLGPPGGGWDGPYGITERQFEFEPDDEK